MKKAAESRGRHFSQTYPFDAKAASRCQAKITAPVISNKISEFPRHFRGLRTKMLETKSNKVAEKEEPILLFAAPKSGRFATAPNPTQIMIRGTRGSSVNKLRHELVGVL